MRFPHVRAFAMVVGLLVVVEPAVGATQDKQPIAKELREAKTAYLMKYGVDPRLLDRFSKEIAAWKRFALTDDLKSADIVMTLSEEQLEAKGGAPAPTLIVLTVAAGAGGPTVWTDKERSGVTTGAAANLVKRLRDRLEKAAARSLFSRTQRRLGLKAATSISRARSAATAVQTRAPQSE